jgi:hypothetical protein
MPKQHGIILKVPKGTQPPAGFEFVRSLRTMNVYKKKEAAPVPQSAIDDLMNMFSRMNVKVQVSVENDLESAMSKMTIGGKRKTRKSRSSRKTTRRRR